MFKYQIISHSLKLKEVNIALVLVVSTQFVVHNAQKSRVMLEINNQNRAEFMYCALGMRLLSP